MPPAFRRFTLAFACALAIPSAFAQQPDAGSAEGKSTGEAAPAAAPGKPLLWKVSDADNHVYLLGSFHLLKATDYPLPAEVDRAFDDAESLLFEIDPVEMNAPDLQARMQKYMAYEEGKSLSTVLPQATLDKLGKLLAATGGSLQAFEQTEPWAISLGMVVGITQAMGFRQELGVDRYLMDRAAKAGKPTAGLETIDDQVGALDAEPYEEQARSLEEFLDDPGATVARMQGMHAAWLAGDAHALDKLQREEMIEKTPESYRLLVVDRNNAWLPKVEKRLAESSRDDTMVVVGALHLLGEDGLVEKLRAKGYTVERICDACAP